MSERVKLKRGDTLEISVQYVNDDGTPVDLTDYDIRCQGRLGSLLIFDRFLGNGIIKQNPIEGKFLINIVDTQEFPLKVVRSDIQYIKGGNIKSTETFEIAIEEDITR